MSSKQWLTSANRSCSQIGLILAVTKGETYSWLVYAGTVLCSVMLKGPFGAYPHLAHC